MQAQSSHPAPNVALRGDPFLIGIVVGAVTLIVVGIVVAALGVGRSPTVALDPTTPAGTVQSYVTALRTGDLDTAYGYLSAAAQASWSRDRYRENYPRYAPQSGTEQRLLIETVRTESDRADVRVTVSYFMPGNPLFAGTPSREVEMYLVKESGVWKIDRPVEPYPFLF
jgi:hypothetical protein